MSQRTSIENSPRHCSWTKDWPSCSEEELQLLAVVGAADVAGAEALARLHEEWEARVLGHIRPLPAARGRDPVLDEEPVCLELVRHAFADLRLGEEEEGASAGAAREHRVVEVVERHDEAHVVLADELAERADVAGIGDAGHDRLYSPRGTAPAQAGRRPPPA